MKEDEQDPVWQVLGRAPRREASGAFVQNTLRRVRLLEHAPERRSWFQSFFVKSLLAGAAAAVIAMGVFLTMPGDGDHQLAQVPAPVLPVLPVLPVAADPVDVITEELGVMTYVDELLAVNDPNELDDEALAEILFSY